MPTALIVEDEPAANGLLAMLVQLRGYRTDSAFTGDEALRKADDHLPDLVFLDLMLPDINGYEVCKALKARRATGGIPVVMVTARLADENRVQGFRAGAVEYIPKPYTPDQIFGAMSRADSWRSRLDATDPSGELALDASEEVAHLLAASDLRSLLLARTALDEDEVGRLGSTLLDLLQRGVDWGRAHRRDLVATLDYAIGPDRVAFRLLDRSGWFEDDDPGRGEVAALLARGGFETVEVLDGRELRLARGVARP